MLTSNGTTENIAFFVKWVRDANPEVWPAVIMTDCDQAQINALETVCYAPLLIFGARTTYLLLVSSDYRLCVLPARFSALPDFFRT